MLSKLRYILTLRCEEADRLRSRQALEPLSLAERLAMAMHQLVCKSCRIAAKQIRILDQAISRLRDDAAPPTAADAGGALSGDARQRLSQALRDAENSQE
ncbi:MAG TPA: hypothetical protein PK093_22840 [Phycisphaerae bacterium]|mgnify:CR=1 FL=1|nr:hypothetical protein [Phycisphaerae bacterium]